MLGYLDAGNVSMALGAVAAGAAGVGVAIKSGFAGLRGKRRSTTDDDGVPTDATDDDADDDADDDDA